MTFEDKKQEIIENIILAVGIGIMVESEIRDIHIYLDKLKQLQPDVKTCQSCVHRKCSDNPNILSWKCSYLYSPVYKKEFFGHEYNLLSCIHHKERVDDESISSM